MLTLTLLLLIVALILALLAAFSVASRIPMLAISVVIIAAVLLLGRVG